MLIATLECFVAESSVGVKTLHSVRKILNQMCVCVCVCVLSKCENCRRRLEYEHKCELI
jgi:hypothetical protein